MKRFFKHFFQTILLIALAWLIIQIPYDPSLRYWNMAVWGIIFCLLIGMGIYLYRGHKKGLFALLLFLMLFPAQDTLAAARVKCENEISVSVSSEDKTDCPTENARSYYLCALPIYKLDFCNINAEFDPDEYIKQGKKPNEAEIRTATKFLDLLDRSFAASVWTESEIIDGAIGVPVGHNGMVRSGELGKFWDTATCAKSFLNSVAEYKKKKYEQETKTVQDLLKKDKDKCWPCGIIHTLIYATEKITLSLEETLSNAALQLLGIMFLFWILVKVLMLIGQFGTANIAEFFTDFLTRSILAIIAAVLLTTSMGEVYRLTFSPFIDVTLHITEKFLDPYKNTDKGLGTQLAGFTNLGCSCCPGDSDYSADSDCNSDSKGNAGKISECKVEYDNGSESIGILEKQTKQHILCTVCKIYKETAPMIASGQVLTFHAWTHDSWLGDLIKWVGNYSDTVAALSRVPVPFCMWVLGIALIVSFSWLATIIAFRLIDVFLRLGFAILLTPFLVVTFVFPISRQYTKRGWDFLAHAALSLMAIGLGISLVMSAFMVTLPSSATGELKNLIQQTSTDNLSDYAEKLMNAFGVYNENKGVSTWYMAFYLFMVCFFGTSIIKASQVVIEGLSGLSCGIPPIAGAAVMGAIRASLAPFRMAKNVALDALEHIPGVGMAASVAKAVDPTDAVTKGGGSDSADHGIFASTGKFAGEAAGNTVEKIQTGIGKAEAGMGDGMIKLGAKISPAGYGLGSIIGVPLMIAGATLKAKGTALKATAPLTGKAIKTSIKTTSKNMQKGWNRVKRNVKNRMKKMLEATIKKPFEAIRNLPKNIKRKYLKSTRRMRARKKYRQQKASGRGPANWKPSRREGTSRTESRSERGSDSRSEGSNPLRAAENTGRNRRPLTREELAKRRRRNDRITSLADAVESSIDSTLNAAEDSTGDSTQ